MALQVHRHARAALALTRLARERATARTLHRLGLRPRGHVVGTLATALQFDRQLHPSLLNAGVDVRPSLPWQGIPPPLLPPRRSPALSSTERLSQRPRSRCGRATWLLAPAKFSSPERGAARTQPALCVGECAIRSQNHESRDSPSHGKPRLLE